MNIIWSIFYFKLPDGRIVDAEIVGSSIEECKKYAEKRAAYAKAEILRYKKV